MAKKSFAESPAGPVPSSTEVSGQSRLSELRAKHPRFHYEGFTLTHRDQALRVEYRFRLEPDIVFNPNLKIQGVPVERFERFPRACLENLFFHVGLVEMLSYWKAAAPAEILVHTAGTNAALNADQIGWWLDLLRRGMGEFFYLNQLDWRAPDFVRIVPEATSPGVAPAHFAS